MFTPHICLCLQDGQWSIFHFIFAVASPVPMSIFLLIIVRRWEGIITLVNGVFPLSLIIVLCGKGKTSNAKRVGNVIS